MHCTDLRRTEASSLFLYTSCSYPCKYWIKGGAQLEQTSGTILNISHGGSPVVLNCLSAESGREHGEYATSTQKAPWRQALVFLDAW